MMKAIAILLLAVSAAIGWKSIPSTDAFRGTHYTRFVLEGRFLTPPQHVHSLHNPLLILDCKPGRHRYGYHWYRTGDLVDAYINVGTILATERRGIPVQYRLDDGQIQNENWKTSTDFSALYASDATVENLLFGHLLPHKEHTSPMVKSFKIEVDENVAAEIVMQFDLPDSTVDVANACGLIAHEK